MEKRLASKTSEPDLSELLEIQGNAKKNRYECGYARALAVLSDEEQQVVEAAMANPAINGTTIVQYFKRRNVPINNHSLRYHRRGDCTCG